jgi:hypothetical protein
MAFTALEYETILAGDNAEARQHFLAAFPRRIASIALAASRAHRALESFARVQENARSRHVLLYLHAAFNNVVSSTNLLVNGYPLPASHLMRQFGEACAMAMLIVDPQGGVLEAIERNPNTYPANKSLSRVMRREVSARLRRLLGLDAGRWAAFKDLTEFYHYSSHASPFSLGFHVKFAAPTDLLIIGSEYDPGKKAQLSIELRRRRSAFHRLAELARAAKKALPARPRRKSAA